MSGEETARAADPAGAAGKAAAGALLGIDVGGTFTDAVLFFEGSLFRAKVPTSADQSEAVLTAAREVLSRAGCGPEAVSWFGHGMTTATNALLERKGVRTASVATEGFRDILEIGRQNRPRLYDLCPQRPEPLVAPMDRFTAAERVTAGGVVRALSPDELGRIVAELRESGAEAVAVCLLFAYLEPAHEALLADAIRSELPGLHVSLSSEVLPQFREYERFSTTVVDAYLTPVVSRYLQNLGESSAQEGLPEPAIMQSSGGVAPLGQAVRSAAPLLLSGPAAGVTGAVFAGRAAGVDNLIAFDMGGTSTDVSLVRGGVAGMSSEREIGGQPVALPMLDIHTIGAGGGSIAWIDAGGALRVGPESAGADPGPACYGKGGQHATVTDANLCLGYLGVRLGGEGGIELDRDAAAAAVGALAEQMGLSLEQTAVSIRQVANAEMLKALRVISVERGHDPRDFTLVAFGGAGPMHAIDLAVELGDIDVIAPDSCGVLSALGMVVGDQRRDWVKTVYSGRDWDSEFLAGSFAELEKQKTGETAGARLERAVDLRYRGQSHELTVEVGASMARGDLTGAFDKAHQQAFGYSIPGEALELVTIRLSAVWPLGRPQVRRREQPGGAVAERRAWFGGWRQIKVYCREYFTGPAISPIEQGPLIVEDDEATLVVPPAVQVTGRGAAILVKR